MTHYDITIDNDIAMDVHCYIIMGYDFVMGTSDIATQKQFSVPQIEYPLGGSSQKGSHVYFLLIVAMVLLLWCQIVLLWYQVTMVAPEQHLYQTIILPRKIATATIHDYLYCYCPLVGILFEVLRIHLDLQTRIQHSLVLVIGTYSNFWCIYIFNCH